MRGAGINRLCSREYFQLARDRLRDGGVLTYWLPVNQLWLAESKAIIRAFCDVLPDCSLWSGAGLQWMLAGTRGAHGPVPEDQFTAQWRDPVVAPELIAMGFDTPETLGATFLADAETLNERTRGVPPLDDDHPGRILSNCPPEQIGDPIYLAWMEPRSLHHRFERSDYVRALWPAELRRRTGAYFAPQAVLDDLSTLRQFDPVVALYTVLKNSSLRTLPLLLMGSEPARHLALATEASHGVQARLLQTLALLLLGRMDEAGQRLALIDRATLSPGNAYSVGWLECFQQTGRPPLGAIVGSGKSSPVEQ